MIAGHTTFSDQAAQRADWYIGRNEDGTFSLLVDDGLSGRELGRSDYSGLQRLRDLVRLHNRQAVS